MGKLESFHLPIEEDQLLTEQGIFDNKAGRLRARSDNVPANSDRVAGFTPTLMNCSNRKIRHLPRITQ